MKPAPCSSEWKNLLQSSPRASPKTTLHSVLALPPLWMKQQKRLILNPPVSDSASSHLTIIQRRRSRQNPPENSRTVNREFGNLKFRNQQCPAFAPRSAR